MDTPLRTVRPIADASVLVIPDERLASAEEHPLDKGFRLMTACGAPDRRIKGPSASCEPKLAARAWSTDIMTTSTPAAESIQAGGFSRMAGQLDLCAALVLAAGLGVIWYVVVIQAPTSLWGVPLDPPVMALAQGVNIDFWFREPGHRALSQAQYYQPGLWFQFASYAAYRATGGAGSPEQLFDAAMRDPQAFWNVLRLLPLLFSFIGMALLWRLSRGLGPLARSLAIASYFICSAALTFGTTLFFNESLTLVLAAIYFAAAFRLLAASPARPILAAVICGLASAVLYLHKMNYVVWSLALIRPC